MNDTLKKILEILGLVGTALSLVLTGGALNSEKLAVAIIDIIKAANDAHIAHTGQPIDPSILTPEQPV